MFPSYLEVGKTGSQLFSARQTLLQLLEIEKSGSLLFGDQKMQVTTVRSKEKDYDIYLKSEKLVHNQQQHENMFPSYLELGKTGSQLFRA